MTSHCKQQAILWGFVQIAKAFNRGSIEKKKLDRSREK